MSTPDSNIIHVSATKSVFPYVEMTKRLLEKGEPNVVISGLGGSINTVVSAGDILQSKGFTRVTKIQTSRGEIKDARNDNVPCLAITVVKTDKFDALYATEKKEREERKEKYAAEKAAKAAAAEKAAPAS